jgi:hypothetical protein
MAACKVRLSEVAGRVIELAKIVQAEIEASRRGCVFYRADELPRLEPSPAREELRAFLCGQPVAVIYTLMLIMYAGRGDVEVTRLIDEYHERHYAFGNPIQAVDHMLSKGPLPDYLEEGIRLLARAGTDIDRLLGE